MLFLRAIAQRNPDVILFAECHWLAKEFNSARLQMLQTK
jgi:hypothetical protein